ncbi:TniQ family protein [Cereibacter azotoformans]|uniref:TniQ family protein n=1 Tax=Cereibacter azotoformans TaxID=43057 RepID=UPI000E35E6E5|nr:TniQ family protein [Cereibacter azotoformans]AXQ95515.1 hypothetical protein D0Z66_17210 [Cereibacter sphaeroides]UIJ32241.1 TniQ family protein [Cereibacter azotoformans]
MNSILTPRLPFDSAETLLSWGTRLAALHTGSRLIPFLRDLAIDPQAFVTNSADAVARLCEMTDEDPVVLQPNLLHRRGPRQFELRGETFGVEFMKGRMTAFCPACLAEDEEGGGVPHARRRGRLTWMLRPVRTCPDHGLPLIERCRDVWDDLCHELPVLVPETGNALPALTAGLEVRAPSGLQDYLVARLAGKSGPDWLDGQSIEQAARATEMLGALIEFGPKRSLRDLTSDDWDRAGRSGWAWTSRGVGGIREALKMVQDGFEDRQGSSGPQNVFGHLYKWLAFNKNRKDFGPIREVLREHIFDTMEVKPGQEILGEVLPVRRRHSVYSLAREFAIHPKTMRNLLQARGAIGMDLANRPDSLVTVEAAEGERLAISVKNSVSVIDLPEMLNTSRPQAKALIDSGLLKPIGGGEVEIGRMRCAIDRRDVETLLADLERRLPVMEGEREGMHGIARAAEHSRVSVDVILPKLLDGTLRRVGRVPAVDGLAAVRLDPDELTPFAQKRPRGCSHTDAFRLLKLPFRIGQALMADRPGGALLRSHRVPASAWSLTGIWLMPEDVEAFRTEYATHGNLCSETGLHHQEVTRRLQRLGVPTAVDPGEIGTRVYRRADLPEGWAA